MTFHIGLIGGGNITETHARAVKAIPGAKIAAIYGANPEKVARLSREYGGRAYSEFENFLNHHPMDLVMIGSPSGLHAQQGIAAAQRGLHILTEKPIEITTARTDALIAAAEKSGVKLGVIFQDRTRQDVRRLKQWVDDGVLGKPLLAEARVKWYRQPEYYGNSRWRGTISLDGGGALINQAVHTLDLLLWLLGDVVGVQARTATSLHAIEAEDTALAILEFANKAFATFLATTAAFPGYPRRLEITGSEGTVVLENDRIVKADVRSVPNGFQVNHAADDNERAASPVVSDFSGHQAVLEDFLHAIEQNRAPMCDGKEARRSIAVVEQIYQAAKLPAKQ